MFWSGYFDVYLFDSLVEQWSFVPLAGIESLVKVNTGSNIFPLNVQLCMYIHTLHICHLPVGF